MAAPTLQAEGTLSAVTSGTITASIPTHQANDIIVISAVVWVPTSASHPVAQIPTPTGSITYATAITQTDYPTGATASGWIALFWGRAAGAGSTATLARGTGWATGPKGVFACRAYVIRGCATSGNPWDDVKVGGPYTAVNQNLPALTVSGTERMAVQFGASQDGFALSAVPSGWTPGISVTSGTGTDSAFRTARLDNISTSTSATMASGPSTAPAEGAYSWTGVSFKSSGTIESAVPADAVASALVPGVRLAVTGPSSSATASHPAPVAAIRVTAPVSGATASGLMPPLPKVIVTAEVASATASVVPPSVTAGNDKTLFAVPPTATASLPDCIPQVSVTASPGSATASSPVPTPWVAPTAVPADAAASVPAPELHITSAGLQSPPASATASGLVPAVSIVLAPLSAVAGASFPTPNLPHEPSPVDEGPTQLVYLASTTMAFGPYARTVAFFPHASDGRLMEPKHLAHAIRATSTPFALHATDLELLDENHLALHDPRLELVIDGYG